MKNTYIAPTFLLVKLNSRAFIAQSFAKNDTGAEGDVLVKENYPPITDRNVWDDEW